MLKVAVAILIGLQLLLGQACAGWHEVETENFVVRGDASRSTLEKFAVELENFRELLGAITYGESNPESVKVPVFIMSSDASFDDIFPSQNALGVYTHRIAMPIFVGNAARGLAEGTVGNGPGASGNFS